MKIGEFFVTLAVQADTLSVKDFAGALGALPIKAAAAAGALYFVQKQIASLVDSAIGASIELQNFEATTGLSAQALQRWQIAAQQMNISAETVTSSISGLQRELARIRLGEGNIRPFSLLGIDVNQDALGALNQLRANLRGLRAEQRATAVDLMQQMGISPEMIKLLMLSNEELRKRQKLIPGLSREQQETFLQTKKTLVEIGLILKQFGYDIVSPLAHSFNFLAQKIRENETALRIVRDIFLGLTFPIWAVILLIDDIVGYFEGKDSALGAVIEGLKVFAHEIEQIFSKIRIPNADTVIKLLERLSKVTVTGLASAAIAAPLGGKPIADAAKSVIQQTFNISVSTKDDARTIADTITSEIIRQTDGAEAQVDNGGH